VGDLYFYRIKERQQKNKSYLEANPDLIKTKLKKRKKTKYNEGIKKKRWRK